MSNLYNELAEVYEAMYQTFIDYKAEYTFYSSIINEYNRKEVLEIGCGTGNLVPYFEANQFDYIGFDLSEDMIRIAQEKVPNGQFLLGDMRDFKLEKPVESIIITARTISYLLENKDVISTFKSLFQNLKKAGIIAFDFIDANRFLPIVATSDEIIHTANYKDKNYVRKSDWSLNFEYGMSFKWNSNYYLKNKENLQKIGQDNSILRTFTKNEIELFLTLQGFKVEAFIDKPAYAFPTYVVVARKD